jgi:predicted signal transduction protein with EAL and GGDEF domain
MGNTVGLTVVVEGVESEEVDDLVRRMGVGYAQGTYYGTAMTAPELAAMSDRLSPATARAAPGPRGGTHHLAVIMQFPEHHTAP